MTHCSAPPRRLALLGLLMALLLQSLATPAIAAGEVLYVATWGDDYAEDGYSTPENTFHEPWRTISMAVRRARPGDTIVVRGGTYDEAVGWGAVAGTASRPITLTARQGERVVIKGHLQLVDADHWTVRGVEVVRDPDRGRDESLVKFAGGTGWSLLDSRITGSIGVSNLMVHDSANGPAHDFRIAGNCISSMEATGDPVMNNHNIYLYPGLDSRGGVVERNLIFDATNGAAIKAGGPTSSRGAANVVIRFNTLALAGAGVTVPYNSHDIRIERNLIALQRPRGGHPGTEFDAGVVGNSVRGTGNLAIDNAVAGFERLVSSSTGTTNPIVGRGNVRVSPAFDGTSGCSHFRPADTTASRYGHLADGAALPGTDGTTQPAEQVDFVDTVDSIFRSDIRWLAGEGITNGCNPPTNSRFCPDRSVTRAQMAAFLVRALELPPGDARFADVGSNHVFASDIAALADAGITRGCGGGDFCPSDPVTRGQMAAFLTRAYSLAPGTATFDDVGPNHVFASDIAALADAGITRGCGGGDFCPSDPVTRGQMAAFLRRAPR